MALPTASDNPFTSLLVTEGTAPAAPAAGKQRVYIDSADHKVKRKDSSGTVTTVEGTGGGAVASDVIWDAAGDLAVGTGADTAAKLTLGASGKVPASNGSTLAYVFPPGYQFDRASVTTSVSISATAWGSATTVVTGGAVTYDGSTEVILEFFCPGATTASNASLFFGFFDGATQLGVGGLSTGSGGVLNSPFVLRKFWTPSAAAHTITVKALVGAGTATATCGDGTGSNYEPLFLRIIKA